MSSPRYVRSASTLVAFLALLIIGACSPFGGTKPITYYGKVLYESTGTPASGVSITAYSYTRGFLLMLGRKRVGSAESGAEGQFVLTTSGGRADLFEARLADENTYVASLELKSNRDERVILRLVPGMSNSTNGCFVSEPEDLPQIATLALMSVITHRDATGQEFRSLKEYREIGVITAEEYEIFQENQHLLSGCNEHKVFSKPCVPCARIDWGRYRFAYDDVFTPIRWLVGNGP